MSRFSPVALGLAVPLSLFCQAAFADLTPSEVWGDWKAYMLQMGYQVSATETANGGDLSVSNIDLSFSMPEGEGTMNMALGTIDFNQNSDGSVAIILPSVMPITISGNDGLEDGEDFNMVLNYSQTGHALTASGSAEALTYAYATDTFAMNLAQMRVGDDMIDREHANAEISGVDFASTTVVTLGDMRQYDQTGSIGAMAYDMFVRNAENGDAVAEITGTVNGVKIAGKGSIPLTAVDSTDLAAMLGSGFDVAGTISYGGGSANFDLKDPQNGNFVVKSTSNGGDFGVKVGANGLAYDLAQRDLNIGITVEGMPMPFEFNMAESGFNLLMPVSKSDYPQDFALGMKMADFTMSDMIWGIFDPMGQLPRDPASVLLDISGTLKLLVDVLNPDVVEDMVGAPGEVQSLRLGALLVSAAGARLDGTGDVAFDGNPAGMVPGAGNPVGEMNFAVAGGNALLDKLVDMGLLPADQAMGARMMMGLFAVPGEAPDTLKSKIEFTPEGQILANGQRIR
jgi:hypothetical protein